MDRWTMAAAGLILLAACRDEAPAPSIAPSAPSTQLVSGESPCAPGEMRFNDLGVCAQKSVDGCYLASLSRDARGSGAISAGPARFNLVNEGSAALYVVIDPASAAPAFQIAHSEADMPMAEAQFCPNWCPDAGPVMELDCMPPAPAMLQLAPGGTVEVRWAGEIALPYAKSCGGGPARACLRKSTAPAGRYRATFCAYAAVADAALATDSTGRLPRATPAGEAHCTDVEFEMPSGSPIRAGLK